MQTFPPWDDRPGRFPCRQWDGRNSRRRAAPGARLEPLPYKLEDGSPILSNHLHPSHFAHHREIDATETEARNEDIKAITQRLVFHRINPMRQRLRTIGLIH